MRKLTFTILTALVMMYTHAQAADISPACTAKWCQESLAVNMHADSWPVGNYTFIVRTAGSAVTCTAHLPFNGCSEAPVVCSGTGVVIGTTGCALPPNEHGFTGMTITPPPPYVSITINGPEQRTFGMSNKTNLQCSYPNGKFCDKRQCCSATLDLPVVWNKK